MREAIEGKKFEDYRAAVKAGWSLGATH
jgi:hypothetical protein